MMYIPKHFAAKDDPQVEEFLKDIGACDLITVSGDSLLISTLPMLHVPSPSKQGWGTLQGHLARQNPHVAAEGGRSIGGDSEGSEWIRFSWMVSVEAGWG